MSKKSSTFALAFGKEAAGCSSARLECLLWEQEVVSSNLAIPTNQKKPLKNEWLLSLSIYAANSKSSIQ